MESGTSSGGRGDALSGMGRGNTVLRWDPELCSGIGRRCCVLGVIGRRMEPRSGCRGYESMDEPDMGLRLVGITPCGAMCPVISCGVPGGAHEVETGALVPPRLVRVSKFVASARSYRKGVWSSSRRKFDAAASVVKGVNRSDLYAECWYSGARNNGVQS